MIRFPDVKLPEGRVFNDITYDRFSKSVKEIIKHDKILILEDGLNLKVLKDAR